MRQVRADPELFLLPSDVGRSGNKVCKEFPASEASSGSAGRIRHITSCYLRLDDRIHRHGSSNDSCSRELCKRKLTVLSLADLSWIHFLLLFTVSLLGKEMGIVVAPIV